MRTFSAAASTGSGTAYQTFQQLLAADQTPAASTPTPEQIAATQAAQVAAAAAAAKAQAAAKQQQYIHYAVVGVVGWLAWKYFIKGKI